MTQSVAAALIKRLQDIERGIGQLKQDITDNSHSNANDNVYNLAVRVDRLINVVHDIIEDAKK